MNAGNKKHNEKDNEMVQLTKIILKQTARHSKKSLTFQKSSKKLFLHWRANLADQNKHQPLKIDIRVTYHTVHSVWNTPLIDTCQHCSTSRANQAPNAGFQNRGVCLQAFPSFPSPSPPLSFFGSSFISRAAKTENPVPRFFLAPKPNGNACYAGYDHACFTYLWNDSWFQTFHKAILGRFLCFH